MNLSVAESNRSNQCHAKQKHGRGGGEFICAECGEPLLPLHHSAGCCPNGHGRVKLQVPKLALMWLINQKKRGRKACIKKFGFMNGSKSTLIVDGETRLFKFHRVQREQNKSSVPRATDTLPDHVVVGVCGLKVRMLEPVALTPEASP